MSRTFQNENISRKENADFAGQGNKAVAAEQGDIGNFNQNVETLKKGGQIGQNPFQSADYLANQNRLTSEAVSGENDAAKRSLTDLNQRTGGRNTGATIGGITQLAGGKMRLGNALSAQRSQDDFSKNLDYQRYLAGTPLQAAGAEQPIYGTASGGVESTGSDLTKYGLQQQDQWYKQIQQMIQAGQAAASAGAKAFGGGGSPFGQVARSAQDNEEEDS